MWVWCWTNTHKHTHLCESVTNSGQWDKRSYSLDSFTSSAIFAPGSVSCQVPGAVRVLLDTSFNVHIRRWQRQRLIFKHRPRPSPPRVVFISRTQKKYFVCFVFFLKLQRTTSPRVRPTGATSLPGWLESRQVWVCWCFFYQLVFFFGTVEG